MPNWEPLGPKNRAQEWSVRTAKMTSIRAAGEVRAVKVGPVRLDCPSELWNPNGNQSGSEVKVYLNDQSYD